MTATPLATTLAASSDGTNFLPAWILLAIFVPLCTLIGVIVWNYYRLQRHRADAVAMASYRKLAEEAVANTAELRAEMARLSEHVRAVEQLMRDVG
jgi:hypothetical protein